MVEITHEGAWVVVRLRGDVDLVSVPAIRQRLDDLLLLGPENVRIDLAEVAFMDSQGLNLLAGAHKQAQAMGGQIVLANVPRQIQQILTLTGLDMLFDFQRATGGSPPGSMDDAEAS